LFRVRIFKGEAINEKVVYQRVINPTREPAGLNELLDFIENLKNHITATVFQCYKREFVKGEKAGKWEKNGSSFEFGDNATSEMLADGSGYYITDPDNGLQYFVDMKQAGEAEK
jgi:hypothetical protein